MKTKIYALIVAVVLLLSAIAGEAAAALQYCSNGVQDGNETGVDCGGRCALTVGCAGNCTSASVVDYCDGKDNDRDCLVDEDCKPQKQPVTPVTGAAPIKGPSPDSQQKAASCSDGLKNQDESWDDCGGVCVTNDTELCDGIDNDRDCLIDEDEKCHVAPQAPEAAPQAVPEIATPTAAPESISAPVPESAITQVSSQAQLTPDIAAEQSPSILPVEAGGDEQIKWLRQFAKSNSIYIPAEEPDAELLKKYTAFAEKHEAELAAKFQDKSPAEKDIADVLKQFSEEAYPKPGPEPQSQSFFSRVKSFFKRLFG